MSIFKDKPKARLIRVFEGKYLWMKAVLKAMEIDEYDEVLLSYEKNEISQDYLFKCKMNDYDLETFKEILRDFMSPKELLIVAE